MLDAIEAVKEKMVLACKVLQKQRVLDGYGHLTARLADGRILSTPHMPPGKVALRDLIIIDADGNKLEGHGQPNGETAMHTSIYKARATSTHCCASGSFWFARRESRSCVPLSAR